MRLFSGAGMVGLVFLLIMCGPQINALELLRIDFGREPVSVRVPDNYDPGVPAPLLMMLHGHGASAFITEALFRLAPSMNAAGVIYVMPEGLVNEVDNRYWNATDACCDFFDSEVDDVGYLTGMVDTLKTMYNIDANRVFFMGHSNGGFMSYRMACERADMIAGIISVAGSTFLDPQACNPSEPVNVLQIHGTQDNTVPFEGTGNYPGALGSVLQWLDYNNCEAEPVETTGLDLDAFAEGVDTTIISYEEGCPQGGSGALWQIDGGGHSPVPTDQFHKELVKFIETHPKSGAFEASEPALLIPHIASDWRNLLLIDNLGETTEQVGLTVFDEEGTRSREVVIDVKPGAFVKLNPTSISANAASGMVRMNSDQIRCRVAYIHPSQGGTAEFALDEKAYNKLFFNLGAYDPQELPLTWKGLAVFNPGDQAANVTFTAYDSDGSELASAMLSIAPHTRYRNLISSLFDLGERSFVDVARVVAQSDQPLSGLNISGVDGAQLLFSPAVGQD